MTSTPAKQVAFAPQQQRLKCSPGCSRVIYDKPYEFHVRSERPSARLYPCESCIKASRKTIQYQQRCSRLPPIPIDVEYSNRPRTSPSQRTSNDINWDNFMKNKSRYAIKTPYALCNLTPIEQSSENRPPFVNYGGQYTDKQHGEKRTFNSLAVHQLKHHEIDDQRTRGFFREQYLRRQAENYFRDMARRQIHEQDRYPTSEYQPNSQE